jgi:hypothetical protein
MKYAMYISGVLTSVLMILVVVGVGFGEFSADLGRWSMTCFCFGEILHKLDNLKP